MTEISAGGIIVRNGKIVVVTQLGNTYSYPKGHVNDGENILDAAYREIYEETGLKNVDLKFIKELGAVKRRVGDTGNNKSIRLFLFTTTKEKLQPMDKDNPEAIWVKIDDVAKHLTYMEDKDFFLRNIKDIKDI